MCTWVYYFGLAATLQAITLLSLFPKSNQPKPPITKNRHITLQLILTQGCGMTVERIKASNRQEVHAPMNFHEMHKQLLPSFLANSGRDPKASEPS